MKFSKMFVLVAVIAFFSCGGDDDKKTTSSSNTDGSSTTQLATLSIPYSAPDNGVGVLKVSSIKSVVSQSGGDQSIQILGTTTYTDTEGVEHEIKHQIDVIYTIYYNSGLTKGTVNQISHAWGETLSGSLTGGISVCDGNCLSTTINPSLNTLVIQNQILNNTTNSSTIGGTVVY